jgi:hypothetical protein
VKGKLNQEKRDELYDSLSQKIAGFDGQFFHGMPGSGHVGVAVAGCASLAASSRSGDGDDFDMSFALSGVKALKNEPTTSDQRPAKNNEGGDKGVKRELEQDPDVPTPSI